jgi:peroxiredoxin
MSLASLKNRLRPQFIRYQTQQAVDKLGPTCCRITCFFHTQFDLIKREDTVAVTQEAAAKEIAVGETAPDFTLKDQDQKDVTLSSFRGKKNVVLIFYPLDWSPVCTGENKCITDDFPKFEQLNAVVLGISTDSFFSHKAWADSLGLKQTLLADFNRDVVKKYGLYFEPLNCGKRATVIVDKNGKVAYAKVQEIKIARDDKDILEALKKLG